MQNPVALDQISFLIPLLVRAKLMKDKNATITRNDL